MLMFREHVAHAHDIEQDAFMESAAIYALAEPKYRTVPWLQDWRASWLGWIGAQGNGVSDIGVEEYLTDDHRIEVFREFLRDYRLWLVDGADEDHAATGLDTDMLVRYAELVEAALTGDETHPRVRRRPDPLPTHDREGGRRA
jgi:hypothetical protein